jgi:hypothetical protein
MLGIPITGASPNRPHTCHIIRQFDLNTIASKKLGHTKPPYCSLVKGAKAERFVELHIVINELTFRVVTCKLRNAPSKLQPLSVNRIIVRSMDI